MFNRALQRIVAALAALVLAPATLVAAFGASFATGNLGEDSSLIGYALVLVPGTGLLLLTTFVSGAYAVTGRVPRIGRGPDPGER